MLNLNMLTLLFVTHWVADYVWQSRTDADTKWSDVWALAHHVSIYILPFTLFVLIYASTFTAGWAFLVFLWISHFVIDFFTSKATHMYYEAKNYKMFFVVLGADQLLHILSFFVLLNWYI